MKPIFAVSKSVSPSYPRFLAAGQHPADNGDSCAVALATETAPWYQENAPGLIRTIGSCFFPVGLIMIVLSGADLFTSNVMVMPSLSYKVMTDIPQFMTTAFLHRRCTLIELTNIWVTSFFGNLAGMLFFMAIITGCRAYQQCIDRKHS